MELSLQQTRHTILLLDKVIEGEIEIEDIPKYDFLYEFCPNELPYSFEEMETIILEDFFDYWNNANDLQVERVDRIYTYFLSLLHSKELSEFIKGITPAFYFSPITNTLKNPEVNY